MYEYRCQDRSLLVPWISRGPAAWLHRKIPMAVSANALTAFGSALMGTTTLVATMTPPGWRERLAPLWVSGLWLYCVFDHVDGQRARARGTSSALGEFLDHGLDAWNVALVTLLLTLMGPPGSASLFSTLFLFAAGGLVTIATWLEQHERGTIYLGIIGPVEAVATAGLYLLCWACPPLSSFLGSTVASGSFTPAALIIGLAAFATLLSAGFVGLRLQSARRNLVEMAVFTGAICLVGCLGWISGAAAVLALVLGTATYSVRIISAHLNHQALPTIDRGGFIALLLVALARRLGWIGWHWELLPLAWLALAACRPWLKLRLLRPISSPEPDFS
jgi:phosphatidylglycerophosphate synthase